MRIKGIVVLATAAALSIGSTLSAAAEWKQQENGTWKYQNENQTWKSNTWFQDADGSWYYLDQDGTMHSGWLYHGGKWYFMAYNGVMQTGLVEIDGAVYFFNPSGDQFIGQKQVNGTVYDFELYGIKSGNLMTSVKFSGNGNQIVRNVKSGGSASGKKADSDTVSAKVSKVNSEIADRLRSINKKSETYGIEAKFESDNVVQVQVDSSVAADSKEALESVKKSIQAVARETLAIADRGSEVICNLPTGGSAIEGKKISDSKVELTIGEEKITKSIDSLIESYLDNKTLDDFVGAEEGVVSIKVNGEEVLYFINCSEKD